MPIQLMRSPPEVPSAKMLEQGARAIAGMTLSLAQVQELWQTMYHEWKQEENARRPKLLFICNAGLRRSPTAAKLFSNEADTRHRGVRAAAIGAISGAINHEMNALQLRTEDFEWADRVFCMDAAVDANVLHRFSDVYYKKKPPLVLMVPDKYGRDDPMLIAHLQHLQHSIMAYLKEV